MRLPLPTFDPRVEFTASKVAQTSVLFWIVKVLTTGAGETTSDFFVRQIDPVIAVVVCFVVLAATLSAQLTVTRYIPWLYWSVVALVSVFGTMVADIAHRGVGIPYWMTVIIFLVALAAVFLLWQRTEGDLSIHRITTRRRELFYWAAVLVTFALGTAAGDLLASSLNIGFLGAGLVFAAIIAVPAIGYFRLRWNAVGSFWFAYIVTRPLGASLADWMGVGPTRGGLDWGTGWVSLWLGMLIVAAVAVVQVRHRYEQRRLGYATLHG